MIKELTLKYFIKTVFEFLLAVVGFTLIYWVVAKMGMMVATINKQASPVWPATGVAFICFYRYGWRASVGVFLGAFFANLETSLPVFSALLIALGNFLECFISVFLFRWLTRSERIGENFKCYISLLVSFGFGSLFSSSIGSFSLWNAGILSANDVFYNLSTWFMGDFLGALYVVPIFFCGIQKSSSIFGPIYYRPIKFFVTLVVVLAINIFVFSNYFNGRYLFLVFFGLLVTRKLLNQFWTMFFCLATCSYAIFQTLYHRGPFFSGSQNDNLLQLQFFLIGLVVTSISFSVLRETRRSYKVSSTLMIGWTLAGGIFFSLYNSSIDKENIIFKSSVVKSEEALKYTMEEYLVMLKGGVGLIHSSDYVSRDDWRVFVESLADSNSFSGIYGIGLILATSNEKNHEPELGKYFRKIDQPKTVFPVNIKDSKFFVSDPERNFIITYIEPFEKNRKAVGLNVATEKNRYEAALKAIQTRKPAMTKQIQLMQDNGARPGVLLYSPFYLNSKKDKSLTAAGLVYMPIVVEDYVKTALRKVGGDIEFELYFGNEEAAQNRVFSSFKGDRGYGGTITNYSEIMGVPVIFKWQKNLNFPNLLGVTASVVGLMGAIVTLLLAGLVSSLEEVTLKSKKIAREMTSELEQQKESWKVLVEKSPIGIYILSANNNCEYTNPALQNMIGNSSLDASKQNWKDHISLEDRSKFYDGLLGLKKGNELNISYRLVKLNGTPIPVQGMIAPILDSFGNVTGFLGTVSDLSDVYEKQKALLLSSRMSNLGEMASGLAHEINNPLAIIQSKSRKLLKMFKENGFSSETVEKDFEAISETVYRIAKIIRSMQSFVGEGYKGPAVEVSVSEVISEVVDFCKIRFRTHQIDLVIPEQFGDLVFFSGRKELISQALIILLNNSFDAVQAVEKKQVKLDLEVFEKFIDFKVEDSGHGLSEEMGKKIFEDGFLDSSKGKTSGLGLSIAKSLVVQHNGEIFIERFANPTIFKIRIPRLDSTIVGKAG